MRVRYYAYRNDKASDRSGVPYKRQATRMHAWSFKYRSCITTIVETAAMLLLSSFSTSELDIAVEHRAEANFFIREVMLEPL